jgi:uncharacterized protein with ATP-grasp and redox domains
MKVDPRCHSCLLEQCKRTFGILNLEGERYSKNMEEIARFINEKFSKERITADLGTEVHRELKRITVGDPYREIKHRSNAAALKLVDYAKGLIESADDPLYQSFKIAIAGNLIDLGTYDFDVDSKSDELKAALLDAFAIDDSGKIKERISNARKIIYLCDNAGEIIFDKLAVREIQKLGPAVTAVVKSAPIVNDATMEDARAAGLDRACRVIESGTDSVGVNLAESSEEFKKELEAADLVIAKGQGHFETMEDMNLPIAFLLKAKCRTVAEALGVEPKSSVVMFSQP